MRALVILSAAALMMLAADLTGKWDMNVEVGGNAGSPSFELKQAGTKLTGTYSGALGESPVTGTVDGDKFELKFSVAPQGDKIDVIYRGAMKADGTVEGTLEIPGLGDGTFKGTKRK